MCTKCLVLCNIAKFFFLLFVLYNENYLIVIVLFVYVLIVFFNDVYMEGVLIIVKNLKRKLIITVFLKRVKLGLVGYIFVLCLFVFYFKFLL